MKNLSIETLNRNRFISGHWFQHIGKPNVYFRHNADDMCDGFTQLDINEIDQYYSLVTDIFDQYAMCSINIFGSIVNFRLFYADCRSVVSSDGDILNPYQSSVVWPDLAKTVGYDMVDSIYSGSSIMNRSIILNNRTRSTF